MDILVQAAQFILSLSLLIILHEMGHFIPAKAFKTRVEKFYLFFDPWFSLVKKKIKGTEYGVGWLPLGGYVKISGMVDESMDKEQLSKPPQPWEFRSKPAWQRLIIMIGGVTVNVILAIAIYAGMMMYYGEEYLPVENLKYGIAADSTAESIGLRDGDMIVSIGETKIERFSQIPMEILLGDEGSITVMRNGERQEILLPEGAEKGRIIDAKSTLVSLRVPYVVAGFTDTSMAQQAGLREGDSIVGMNGKDMYFFNEYIEEIPKYAGDSVSLSFYRNGELQSLKTAVSEQGTIGVFATPPDRFLDFAYHKYGFFEAIPAGINRAVSALSGYVRQFKLIADPATGAYKHVGGFLTIGQQFDTSWNWHRFWSFTAFLSVMLAFLNILPIPALDGGHVVFVLWEMITGRKPSEKVLEYAQVVGFIILMGLLILANGNDIMRLFE